MLASKGFRRRALSRTQSALGGVGSADSASACKYHILAHRLEIERGDRVWPVSLVRLHRSRNRWQDAQTTTYPFKVLSEQRVA